MLLRPGTSALREVSLPICTLGIGKKSFRKLNKVKFLGFFDGFSNLEFRFSLGDPVGQQVRKVGRIWSDMVGYMALHELQGCMSYMVSSIADGRGRRKGHRQEDGWAKMNEDVLETGSPGIDAACCPESFRGEKRGVNESGRQKSCALFVITVFMMFLVGDVLF